MESVVEKIVLSLWKFSYVIINIFVMWTLFAISQLRSIDWLYHFVRCERNKITAVSHFAVWRIAQVDLARVSSTHETQIFLCVCHLDVDCSSTNVEIRAMQRYSS